MTLQTFVEVWRTTLHRQHGDRSLRTIMNHHQFCDLLQIRCIGQPPLRLVLFITFIILSLLSFYHHHLLLLSFYHFSNLSPLKWDLPTPAHTASTPPHPKRNFNQFQMYYFVASLDMGGEVGGSDYQDHWTARVQIILT